MAYTIGNINSVTKRVELPLYTITATDNLANVVSLKSDIADRLTTSTGTPIYASDITLSSPTGPVTSDKLAGGTFHYTAKLTTLVGVKYSFTRSDGVNVAR